MKFLCLATFLLLTASLPAVRLKNSPYYKHLSNDVYFRILNIPGELRKGEIFLHKQLVIELTDSFGHSDTVKDTFFTAGKVQLLIDKKTTPDMIGADKTENGAAITASGEVLVSFNDQETQLRYHMSAFKLAFIYACRLKKALGDTASYPAEDFSLEVREISKGDEYFGNDFLEEAYMAYRKAWKINRKNALACFSMGSIAFYENKFDEAMPFLEKSTEYLGDFPRTYYMIARTALSQGDQQKATVALKMALKFDESNPVYQDLLKTIEEGKAVLTPVTVEVTVEPAKESPQKKRKKKLFGL
ncbi:MAG: tetratricopeptide repeat protein [Candidatus Wallbacteria bacterium]|nr:tetratricopeptide repeat protein [Candidatus Wallbacteria bacterium]